MSPREQPEQQAPPVQRLRIRYAKRGRLRFTSHRDFSRAFERAVFRARVPMAYSSGFNPHPRISYAGAAPTGAASEAEYLEIGLAQVADPAEIAIALEEALPDGLDVLEVVEAVPGSGRSLSDLLTGSRWRVDLPVGVERARGASETFLAQESVLVERMTKKGLREFDCRAAVVALEVSPTEGAGAAGGVASLDMLLRHLVPAVRPDDVLRGIRSVSDLDPGPAPVLTRLEQGTLVSADGTDLPDPTLPADRAGAAAVAEDAQERPRPRVRDPLAPS